MVLMATSGAIIAIGANCGTPWVTMAPLASMVTMETIVRRVEIEKGRRKRKDPGKRLEIGIGIGARVKSER